MDLLHQPDSILIDPGLGLRASGITFKHITCQLFAQRLRDLAAAGIVNTDKRYFHNVFFRFPVHSASSSNASM